MKISDSLMFLMSASLALLIFSGSASADTSKARANVRTNFLPVLKQNAVVLFQGDSITDGGRWPGDDPNHIYGQDYAYLLMARFGADLPERNLTFLNRGVSGNKVTDLSARWQADTLALKPDVLSILVGVNDASSNADDHRAGVTPQQYEQVYDQLIQETQKALPNVQIVLGEPFTLPVGWRKEHFAAWRAELGQYQEVVERLGARRHLPVVRYQKVFDDACRRAPAEHWIWDGIHPTPAGHQLMADEWVRTMSAFSTGK